MSRLQRNPGVSETVLDAEIFLVDGQEREVYYLDAVTSGLWRLLAAPQTLDSCLEVFVAAFPDQAPERLAGELEAVLADFEAHGLVIRVP